jgi:peptidoglycan hydrolase-like protein with peptidoglycan-binding domain
MNIRTGLIAGLGLIAAAGLALPSQAANTTASSAPAATSGSAQPGMTSPSNTSPYANSQANNMPSGNSQANSMSSNSGMSKQDVKALQEALRGQGESVKSDGVWGPGTQSALKHYQQQNGLPATGQLDPATRAKLNLQG